MNQPIKNRMSAEEFCKKHFPGIENETWFIPIVAITEGYNQSQIQALRDKIEAEKRVGPFITKNTREAREGKNLLNDNGLDVALEILDTYINTPVKKDI